MNVLLDTHVVLWLIGEPARIGARSRSVLETGEGEVFYSAVNIAEIAIKLATGHLDLEGGSSTAITYCEGASFEELPIRSMTAARLETLPLHHRDPFDRLLIAQAIEHDLTLMSADRQFSRYPVALFDATQ